MIQSDRITLLTGREDMPQKNWKSKKEEKEIKRVKEVERLKNNSVFKKTKGGFVVENYGILTLSL